jgi:hypothetical protein
MGLRSKPKVTVLADPDDDNFDGIELVNFDTPSPTAVADPRAPALDDEPLTADPPEQAALGDQLNPILEAIAAGDESAAAELVAVSEWESASVPMVEPTTSPAVDAEPYDEPETGDAPGVAVASRRAGRRTLLFTVLGLLAAAVLGGAYLSHGSTPPPQLADKPKPQTAAHHRVKHRSARRPRAQAQRALSRRHRHHHHNPSLVPHRVVIAAPVPAPAPAPPSVTVAAPVRPPVSAPAPRSAAPSGGEFLIGGP